MQQDTYEVLENGDGIVSVPATPERILVGA